VELDPALHVLRLLFHDLHIFGLGQHELNRGITRVQDVQVFLPAGVAEGVDADVAARHELVWTREEPLLEHFF